jgi:hypothetical protein
MMTRNLWARAGARGQVYPVTSLFNRWRNMESPESPEEEQLPPVWMEYLGRLPRRGEF